MKLLVITPTLGRSPWLAETIASVASHASDAIHLLVAPLPAVEPLATRFPHLRLVPEPPGGGMYAAVNAGAAVAGDWEWLCYLNDDDLLLPPFAGMARNPAPEAGIVYGGVRLIDREGRRLGAIPVSPEPSLNRLLYAQRIEPVYQHGTIVSRPVWERLGGFDSEMRFCGDSEFLARATLSGTRFMRGTTEEIAAFRLRAGQLSKDRAAMDAERRKVDDKLGLVSPRLTAAHRWARWRFRLANLPIYAERIRRHGFVSFDQLLARGG